jgi:hypothetical protein
MLRKEPAFDELEYGFNSFARFLESAEKDGIVELTREPGRGGGYRVESAGDDAPSHHRPDNGAEAAAEPNGRAHLSPEAERYRALLVEAGLDPLTPELRRAVVTAFVDEVAERTAANKRVNLAGATSAVARRARPKVGTKAVGAVLDALFKAGELIHADGNPVRSPTASFVVPKSADALLLSLQSHYLRTILDEESSPPDSKALAELLLGDAADAQDIEALMAWLVYETDQRATAEAIQSEPPVIEAEAEALPPEPEEEPPAPKKKRAPTRKPRRKIAGRDAETGS